MPAGLLAESTARRREPVQRATAYGPARRRHPGPPPAPAIMPRTRRGWCMIVKQDRTVVWVAAAVVLALLCCLCVVLVATAASVWFAVDGDGRPTPTAPSTTPAPTPDVPPTSWEFRPVPPEASEMLERLRTSVVPVSDPISLSERLAGVTGIPLVLAETAAPIPLGTVKTFWASNVDTLENFQLQAKLAYATEHVYFWVEQGVSFELDELKALVDEFEAKTYPTTRAFFGSEWSPGVDGDPHLYLLLANGLGNSIAGYYSSNDEYSPLAHEYSNGHEMFYLMAANIDLGSDFTAGVLAHEFQHMIHWYRDRNEETWMNEGFSEVAAHINGFDVGGADFEFSIDPDQTLTQLALGTRRGGRTLRAGVSGSHLLPRPLRRRSHPVAGGQPGQRVRLDRPDPGRSGRGRRRRGAGGGRRGVPGLGPGPADPGPGAGRRPLRLPLLRLRSPAGLHRDDRGVPARRSASQRQSVRSRLHSDHLSRILPLDPRCHLAGSDPAGRTRTPGTSPSGRTAATSPT